MKIELVVTRHAALVEYMIEVGLISHSTPVIAHATREAISGKVVAGVLPHYLSAVCAGVIEVPLALTPADRGAGEMPIERVREIAGTPVLYRVSAEPFAKG